MLEFKRASKLYFGKWESKLQIKSLYMVSFNDPPAGSEEPQWKYKNLSRPLNSLLRGVTVSSGYLNFNEYPYTDMIKVFQDDCANLIELYKHIDDNKDKLGVSKLSWTMNPSYARSDANTVTFEVTINIYAEEEKNSKNLYKELVFKKLLDDAYSIILTSISSNDSKLINGDPHVSIVTKLPFNKYNGKIWLNHVRLRNVNNRESLLTTLLNYQTLGSIRMQPHLERWLKSDTKHMWNDPYIYVEDEHTKNLMELVLVNIISKYEKIVRQNG